MSVRQPLPAAFEIRFSTTDSDLEIFEIQSVNKSQDQNVPDPFKKRDKIPRSSGSLEQFTNISNSNSNSNNSNSSNSSNNNATAPIRHSSADSQAPIIRSRHHPNGDNLNSRSLTNPDQVSSLKVKSSNAVGPEADKQLQRLSGGKNLNIERPNLIGNVNDVNTSEDDSIIRNSQSSNKKQRSSSKADEFTGEKEKNNLGKIPITPNNQTMDLNGKTDMVISNNKKTMPKTILKNKKITMLTNNDEKPIPGIATPPDTPPRSPARSPARSSPSTPQTNQITLEETPLATPPLSSSSINSNSDVSTQSSSKVSQQSRKRRGSQSSQLSSEMPATKVQTPRGRRFSSASKPTVVTEQSQEPIPTQLSNKSKETTQVSQQSQPNPPRSRIPRLSISSRERPVIAKKESQGSLSLSSQGSNKINESKESLSSYPVIPKPQSSRGLRSATSRPIINTSFVTDVEVESESPTSYSPTSPTSNSPMSQSPTSYSSASRSQTSYSPTSHSTPQKKLISHDDVVVPTVAKKLKMYGQLPVVNHDALLGYSEEPEIISPTTENGYMDITDQVIDLFDNPKNKSRKKSSDPDSQRRLEQSVRKNSHSRNSSKTYYVAPRKQNYQQTYENPSSPTTTRFENSSNPSTFSGDKRRKSRREEYIMVIRDDDDFEFIEPHPSVPLVPSEPLTAPAVQVENNEKVYNDQIYQEQVENVIDEKIEPAPVQVPIAQSIPVEAPNSTSGKKKGKRKKQKGNGDLDDDDIAVRKSTCRCSIM